MRRKDEAKAAITITAAAAVEVMGIPLVPQRLFRPGMQYVC